MSTPITELLCYAASGLCLIVGAVLAEKERADAIQTAELLRADANREAVSRFGGSSAEPVKTETRYVEVPVEVEKRVEVAVIPESPLDNPPLLQLIEETAQLQEEMYRSAAFFNAERREVSDHVLSKLHEILERAPLVEILIPTPGEPFQRGLHRTANGKAPSNGATVAMVMVPGVRVAERILRPAIVEIEESATVS